MIPLLRTITIANDRSRQKFAATLSAQEVEATAREAATLQSQVVELQRIADGLDQMREQVRTELERLSAALGEPKSSAGGIIGQRDRKYVSGHPYATGDLKYTYQSLVPVGWLPAEGAYVRKDDFPELFSVVGNAQDTSATGAQFKLPAPTPLDSYGRWIIRT